MSQENEDVTWAPQKGDWFISVGIQLLHYMAAALQQPAIFKSNYVGSCCLCSCYAILQESLEVDIPIVQYTAISLKLLCQPDSSLLSTLYERSQQGASYIPHYFKTKD